jgi:hypothetical protein
VVLFRTCVSALLVEICRERPQAATKLLVEVVWIVPDDTRGMGGEKSEERRARKLDLMKRRKTRLRVTRMVELRIMSVDRELTEGGE